MTKELSEQLFQAIDTIVSTKINDTLPNNSKVEVGTIIGKVRDYLYKIQCNNFTVEAIAEEGKEYQLNDIVYIFIPNGDYSSEKIILGKYNNTVGNQIFQHINPLSQMTSSVTIEIENPLELNILKETEKEISEDIFVSANLLQKKYTRMCLMANFEAKNLDNCEIGEYGLKLEFYSNGILLNSLNLSCLDEVFCTNPYLIIPTLNISKIFDVDKIPIHLVNQLKIILYSKNNFPVDGFITLTNLKIIAGEDIANFNNIPITLYLDYQSTKTYNSQFSPTIHALLINQETLTAQTELLENQLIRWYEYFPGHPGDQYGGMNWKYIETDKGLLLENFVFNQNLLTTEIKAVWCEKIGNDLLNILGISEPIVFKNILANYLNNGKNTFIAINGKTQLPVYGPNNNLSYINSNNYTYSLSFLEDIDVETIEWKISTNGLIKGFLDEDTNEIFIDKIYNDKKTKITIVPEDTFDLEKAQSANNVITCIVNGIYSTDIKINFELLSTQGTNYIFQIQPKSSPYLQNIVGATQDFGVTLTMTDGTVIPIIANNLSWSWYQHDTYYNLISQAEEPYISINNTENGEISITLQKIFNTDFVLPKVNQQVAYSDEDNNTSYVINIEDQDNDVLLEDEEIVLVNDDIPLENEENEDLEINDVASESIIETIVTEGEKCNTHILQAKYLIDAVYKIEKQEEITKTIELVAYYPIKVVGTQLPLDNLEINGIFELNWNNEGKLISFLENKIESPEGVLGQEEYNLSTVPDAIWHIKSLENKNYYNIKVMEENDETQYYLQLPQGQNYVSEKVSVIAIDPSGNLLYQQPLMLTMNNFSIDMTNKWAGGVVTIDEEAATIMATAMGAGHKNIDNSFTGVLMGDVQLNQQSDIDSGLFGFNNGKMVFKLNKDAEFFVGSDKDNYISFADEQFDLKTQVLKLNALQDNFVIDSTGTSSADFEYEINKLTITSSSQEEEITEGEENNSDLKTEDYQFGEETHVKTVSLDNAVMAAHNNFVITANGELYIKNIKGLSMAKDSLISATSVAGLVPSLKDMQEGLNNNLNKIVESYNYTTANLNKEIQETKDSIDSFSGTIGEEVKKAIDQKRIPTLDENGAFDFSEILGDNPAAIIGSWSINDEYLYASKNGEVLAFLSAKQPSEGEPETEVNNWFLWSKDTSETRSAENATGFGVTKNGTLYAENGSFRGRIEAESGNIAGFDFIKFGDENTPIMAMAVYEKYEPPPGELDWNETSTHLTTFISGKGYNGASSIGKSGENIDWKMWFGGIEVVNGSSTEVGRFGVTTNGTLWAQDAHIAGTITAKEGYIGKWLLQNGNLFTSEGEYTAFFGANKISGSDVDGTKLFYNLFMGKYIEEEEKWVGKFGVTDEGIMYAENAIVNGVFKIDKQVITKYEVGQITSDYPTEIQVNGALGAGVIPFLDFGYAQGDTLQQSAGLLLQENIKRPYRGETTAYIRELFLGNTYPLQSAEDYPIGYDNVFEGGDYLISRYSPGLNIVSLAGQQPVKDKLTENGRGPSRLSLISSAYTSLKEEMEYLPVQIQLIQQYKADLSSDRKAGQMTMLTSEFLFYAGSLSSVDRYDYESGLIMFNDTNTLDYGCSIMVTSLDATRREAPRRLDVQTDTIAIDCNNIEININNNNNFKINRPLLIENKYKFRSFESSSTGRKGIQIVDTDTKNYFLLDFNSGQVYFDKEQIT